MQQLHQQCSQFTSVITAVTEEAEGERDEGATVTSLRGGPADRSCDVLRLTCITNVQPRGAAAALVYCFTSLPLTSFKIRAADDITAL